MNCKEVALVVDELARNQIMDAGQREGALAHAAACLACAMRLEDARSLSEGMRLLGAEAQEAPARIETALVAAFRDQLNSSPRIDVRDTRPRRSRWSYIAAGIAAAAIIAIVISLIASRTRDAAPGAPQQAKQHEPSAGEEKASAPSPVPDNRSVKQAVTSANQSSKRTIAASGRPRKPVRGTRNADELQNDVEIATDFIPLINRESFAGLDNGQLVRVELPRSALMSFGLPINMESAEERVKADVVVGQDGLARAIRFVR